MIIALAEEPTILSSNVSQEESGIAVWDADATYDLGYEVQVNDTVNKKYKALQDVPAGVDPSVDAANDDGVGTYWVVTGATNYAKPFETLNSSVATNPDSMSYAFAISDIDVLLLTSIKAKTVRAIVTNLDSDLVVMDETFDTSFREVLDWFDWTYAQLEYGTKLHIQLPLVFNAQLELILEDAGNVVEVGHIVYGRSKNVGITLALPNPTTTRRSLTTKARDKWGNIVTRKKARFSRMTINCLIDSYAVDTIEDRLEKFVDKACLFIGDFREGGYKTLSIFGEIKDHDMPIGVSKTQYKIEVEGYL